MNGRLKNISNILVTIKHKSRFCKYVKNNEKSLLKLTRFNCVSYTSNNLIFINYKYNKTTIPNIRKNVK